MTKELFCITSRTGFHQEDKCAITDSAMVDGLTKYELNNAKR